MVYTIFILPLLMIGIGFLMLKKPPRKINWFIGYRTRKSMENEKMWKMANQYCGKTWINVGILMLFVSILLSILLYFKLFILTEMFAVMVMFIQLFIILLSIFMIENKLKNYK